MLDLVIKNGKLVFDSTIVSADIAVKGDKIWAIGYAQDFPEAVRVIDASGKYVMPGAIDAHMHVEAPFQGCLGANDFYTQSISAAFGGVTMFMDFTNTFKGMSVLDAFEKRKEDMSKSAIDYSIHGKFVEAPPERIAEIEGLVDRGCPTFKLFMTYRREGVMATDETLMRVFERAKELSALPMVHAESNVIAEYNLDRFVRSGKLDWHYFAAAKPVLCEAEAFSRALSLSRVVGNALLVVHTTNGAALGVAEAAQKKGVPIYVETCPHYLFLFSDNYDLPDGHLYICSPPLRTEDEAESLWQGMRNGTISVTGSDDCTYSRAEKEMFLEKGPDGKIIRDFRKVVNGVSGIETRLPLLLSEGVNKGRLSIKQVCALVSSNIAKLYGCYPQKGVLAPGSDADITIVDMEKTVTLSAGMLHNNVDYCLFDGMKIKGMPVMTISRGAIIIEDGKFHGKRGAGQFVPRKMDPQYTQYFAL